MSRVLVVNGRDLPTTTDSASNNGRSTADARDKQPSSALGPNQDTVYSASDAPSPQISLLDSQDLSRMSAISGLSEDLIRSLSSRSSKHPFLSPTDLATKPQPSPTGRLNAATPNLSATLRDCVEQNVSSRAMNVTESQNGARPVKAAKTARRSMFIENLDEGIYDQGMELPAVSGKVSKHAATTVEWPLPTPTASPALGMRFQDSSTAVDDSEASYARAQSPPQTATPYATVISPQARKSPRFLPKFLSRAKSPGEPKIGPTIEEKSPAAEATSPQSFFDDESSDGGEDSQIESAQHAIIASPVIVKNGSKTRVGLQEMLGTTPPGRANGAEPSKERTVKLLGADQDGKDDRRPSIRMVSEHRDTTPLKDGSIGPAIWRKTFTSSPLGMEDTPSPHSMPVSSSKSKPPRKVSFPAPTPLDIKSEHRFLRQSIVSTPYPPGGDYEAQETKVLTSKNGAQDNTDSDSILTLVVYGNSGSPPKMKRIVIPKPQATSLVDESTGRRPNIRATLTRDFDDEKLCKLIRTEYNGMRGVLRQMASARAVRNISLLSYRSTSQLVSRHAKPMHLDIRQDDGEFAEARIFKLFQSPKKGRKRHEWTQWIRSQPENIVETPSESDHVALELVEGWSAGKINVAAACVLVCSFGATILWIFIGARRGNLALHNAFRAGAQLGREHVGYRDAGDRVGSGAVLGLLVLFFGWTAVGAWALLSWLIS